MRKMDPKIPPITAETTLKNALLWLNTIRYGESGSVLQLQDDCEYRVLEIINNPIILKKVLGLYYKKYLFRYLPIDNRNLSESVRESIIGICLEKKLSFYNHLTSMTTPQIIKLIANKGYDIGLFISHISPLLNSSHFQPLIDLELLVRTNKNLSVIMFSEIDITSKKYHLLADKCSFLFDNIFPYPMYSEKDSRQFIKHYTNEWQISLDDRLTDQLAEVCGGYLWLIHQAIRNVRNDPKITLQEAVSNDLMTKKIEVLWNKFSNEQKEIIRKTAYDSISNKDTLTEEYQYLKSINIIRTPNNKTLLNIPILRIAVEKENKLEELKIIDNKIIIGKKDITLSLSKKERNMLLLLLSSKKKIVNRDLLAQHIWGNEWEEKYSDWAIDRLAYRLRKRLISLGIDGSLFQTVKKKGFVFG